MNQGIFPCIYLVKVEYVLILASENDNQKKGETYYHKGIAEQPGGGGHSGVGQDPR